MADLVEQPLLLEYAERRIAGVRRSQRAIGVPSPSQADGLAALIHDEPTLASLAFALGASEVGALSPDESRLHTGSVVDQRTQAHVRRQILAGDDPLGDVLCILRSASERRKSGAVLTPGPIVQAMVSWAATVCQPARVIDPGSGSGRFLLAAGRQFPNARLVGIELDPLSALLARANLATSGLGARAEVRLADFRTTPLDGFIGRTLYIGNPPYVRHHLISREWKSWLKSEATAMGMKASALAGLHVYFFLSIARRAATGDCGALITAAEWLDVNYGQLVRDLFVDRLGGQSITIVDPKAQPFPGTATTGAVATFAVGGTVTSVRFGRVESLDRPAALESGRRVGRPRLLANPRWSHFTRTSPRTPSGYVELGELCRVHRGQVTGANKVWIAGAHSSDLPAEFLRATVTRAVELFRAGAELGENVTLRHAIDLPADLALVSRQQRVAVDAFLRVARQMGADRGYVATHRAAWWAIALRDPAPILATYMARQAPAFVLNRVGARHLNIAHGLYPREQMSDSLLRKLAQYLRNSATTYGGREYSGGLTKFEPREMERIAVPTPQLLLEMIT